MFQSKVSHQWGRNLRLGILFTRCRKTALVRYCLCILLTVIVTVFVFMALPAQKETRPMAIRNTRLTLETERTGDVRKEQSVNKENEPASEVEARADRIILLYTTMWGKREWPFFEKIEKYRDRHDNKCPVQNCVISYNKRLFEKANAILFHSFGGDAVSRLELRLLSQKRKLDQIWVYFSHASPNSVVPHPSFFNGFFNWTMTYQQTSDLVIPYSWELGTWQKRSNLDAPYEIVDYADGKDKLLYAEINRCGLIRDRFIKRLQRYVPVDVYGSCSKNFHRRAKIMPKSSQEQLKLKKRYKFFLAAETDYCADFITHRFYKTIYYGYAVPIVLGGADYRSMVIPLSYIDVFNFGTVKQLGTFIKFLDRNVEEYRKYQKWREEYVLGPPLSWTCELCKKLNNENITHKEYKDLANWYDEDSCDRGFDELKVFLNRSRFAG